MTQSKILPFCLSLFVAGALGLVEGRIKVPEQK
jgi:hypothetical protein